MAEEREDENDAGSIVEAATTGVRRSNIERTKFARFARFGESAKEREGISPWYRCILQAPITYVIVVLGIVRVIFGNAVGMSFRAAEYYDDALLINYALRTHYTMPDVYSLAKNMSFPWFIDLCYVLHINLAVGISLLWVVAALAAYAAARILTNGNVWIAGFVYVYVLFYPSAFESWCGTRIYRNSILAPSYILVFSLAIAVLVMIFCNVSRNVAIIVTSVLLGFALSFTYYISDNGSWLTYSLGAAGVLAVFFAIRNFMRRADSDEERHTAKATTRLVASLLSVCIPFATLTVATAAYKAVNNRYFGVAQTNTRTGGEAGGFINRLYRIDSPWRTNEIWAPNDAIHQAIDASPTLRSHTKLCDRLLHSPWEEASSEPDGTSARGDLHTWGLKWAMVDSGTWKSERQSEALFHKINSELDAAFADGTLKKTDRITITASGGGFYFSDFDAYFLDLFRTAFLGNIQLREYTPGALPSTVDHTDSGQMKVANAAAKLSRLPYVDGTNDSATMAEHRARMNSVTKVVFAVYRVVNVMLAVLIVAVTLVGFAAMIVRCVKRRHIPGIAVLAYVVMLGLIGISVVYSFSIAWFVQFVTHPYIPTIVNYYSLGNVALFAMCAMLAMTVTIRMLETCSVKHAVKTRKRTRRMDDGQC